MLVLCYGMQKSGSTLAFELVRGVLTSAGYGQDFIRNDIRQDAANARNYVGRLSRAKIESLIESIGPKRRIAVKTHAPLPAALFAWMEELQAQRAMQVVASFRDPRDICLSLLDAAEKSRRTGAKGFVALDNLDDAIAYTAARTRWFRRWAALRGTLRLDYETVAFAPDNAIAAIEEALNVSCDRAAATRFAFEDALNTKNRAVPHRHREELSPEKTAALTRSFRQFIRQACEKDSQQWYDRERARLLARRQDD